MKRKSLKHRSKRAWIVAGVAAFAGVSLLSTGFAAWVVGITDTTEDGNVNVTVDTTTNSSILLDATLSDSSLRLDETQAYTSSSLILKTDSSWTASANKGDFTVSFSTLSVTYDPDVTTVTSLSLSITKTFSTTTDNTINSWNSTSTNYMDDVDALLGFDSGSTVFNAERTGSTSWTFVDLVNDTIYPVSNDEGGTVDNGNGTSTTSFPTTVLFQWGTWFNHESPCTFYNKSTKLSAFNDATSTEKVSTTGFIGQEMDELYNKVNGETLVLSVSVNYTTNA